MTEFENTVIKEAMNISMGIGSWADPEYTGILYPKGLPAAQRLATYATIFDHAEVNSGYYATPRAPVVEGWVKQTPTTFTFHIKLHRAISQSPDKAARSGDLVRLLLEGTKPLVAAKKLGVFLLVLPPGFSPARHKLAELETLAEKLQPHPLAVELRHNGWVTGDERKRTLDFFRERELVWVAVDMPQVEDSEIMPAIDEVTRPDLAYLRLHGRNPRWFEVETAAERHLHDYTAAELTEVAERIRRLSKKSRHVHVVANNHASDFAPKAALALKQLLRA